MSQAETSLVFFSIVFTFFQIVNVKVLGNSSSMNSTFESCLVEPAMTSIVDSKAHFLKRCREVGLSERAINALTNGFETLGTLAFGVGQPGVALVDGDFQTFARNCLGALASVAETSTLKHLVFESHTNGSRLVTLRLVHTGCRTGGQAS